MEDEIKFYVTVGRGLREMTETYLEKNKKYRIISDQNFEGKIIFAIPSASTELEDLCHLKFVERIFVYVSLMILERSHTKLDIISFLNQTFNVFDCLKNAMDIFLNLHKNDSLSFVETGDKHSGKKRLKLDQTKSFRICCKITGRNKKKIDGRVIQYD